MSMMMMMMICRSMNSPNRRVASFWRMFYDSFLMFSNFNDGYLLFFPFFRCICRVSCILVIASLVTSITGSLRNDLLYVLVRH